MMVFNLLICLPVLLVYADHQQAQLPQLLNADGSLTANRGQYPNNQYLQNHLFQQPGNFFSQTGNELKQAAHGMNDRLHDGVHSVGEALDNAPRNLVDNMNNVGHQIASSFDNMVQNGLNKLSELKSQFAEKFRPLLDNAIQIFQTPRTEKEKWHELVQRVESTSLNEQEKQALYQKIADATSPQQQQQDHHTTHHCN